MNRDQYISDKKAKKPIPPGFIRTGDFERGDKVINLDKIYVVDGHYEVGSEWVVHSINRHKSNIFVSPILNGNCAEEIFTLPCCFSIVEKDWLYKKYE